LFTPEVGVHIPLKHVSCMVQSQSVAQTWRVTHLQSLQVIPFWHSRSEVQVHFWTQLPVSLSQIRSDGQESTLQSGGWQRLSWHLKPFLHCSSEVHSSSGTHWPFSQM
jgi:hypothetical protein